MQKHTLFALVALLFVALAGAGCDTKKGERAALSKKIAGVEAEMARVGEERAGVYQNLEAMTAEINSDAATLQQYSQRRAKLKDELNLYVLDHKLATLAVIATVGGAAAILEDNMDQETKDALAVAGLIGVAYCVFNAEECADVTTRIMYFGSQIDALEKNITSLSAALANKKSALRAQEESYAALSGEIDRLTGVRNGYRQQHDSLLCKGLCL